jgi:hypothetical protein
MATITDSIDEASGLVGTPALGVSFILAMALCAVAWPLATYTLSLAAFGLAHVLSELRFVHRRYGKRIHTQLAGVLVALLAGVVALRIASLTQVLSPSIASQAEVGLALALGIVVLPLLAQRHRLQLGLGVVVCLALAAGLLVSAMHTLLVLAILHNFTPVGFLADATRGARRKQVLAACGVVFVAVPVLIATGLPFDLVANTLGIAAPEASILPAGPLAANLGAYLPPEFHDRPWAMHAFSAVVFTQCMHYAIVIHVLPRLGDDAPADDHDAKPLMGRKGFTLFLIGAGAVWLAAFAWDFKLARSVYGVAAAVHAWVEIPILMVALLGVWPVGDGQ